MHLPYELNLTGCFHFVEKGGVGLEWDGEKDPSFRGDSWRGVDTKPREAAAPSSFPISNLDAASSVSVFWT